MRESGRENLDERISLLRRGKDPGSFGCGIQPFVSPYTPEPCVAVGVEPRLVVGHAEKRQEVVLDYL